MSKQSFTTGQVLTAAQVNSLQANDFNQTVSVKTANYTLAAADKGTRIEFNTSGSVSCTVNSGLFDAGDTLVIQNRGAGTATITAGTATVNTSASLALAQYSAGTLYFVSDSAAIFFGDAAGISASIVDAKGDLIVGTADNTVGRLAVGTNGYTLVADSSVSPTGLKWAAAATGSLTLITTTTVSSAVADITFSSIPSTYQHLSIIFSGRSNKGGNYVDNLRIQMNGVTSSNYQNLYAGGFSSMTVTNAGTTTFADLRYISAEGLMTNGEQGTGIIYFPDYKLTTLKKMIHWETRGVADSPAWFSGQSKLNFTTAVSSIKLFLDGGSFMTGTTASLYGWS